MPCGAEDVTKDVITGLIAEGLQPLLSSMQRMQSSLDVLVDGSAMKLGRSLPQRVEGLISSGVDATMKHGRHQHASCDSRIDAESSTLGACCSASTITLQRLVPKDQKPDVLKKEFRHTSSGMASLLRQDAEVSSVLQMMRKLISQDDMENGFNNRNPHRLRLEQMQQWATWWDAWKEPYDASYLRQFESSRFFGALSSLMILGNSVFIAYSANWSMAHVGYDAPPFIELVELLFLGGFLLELIIRLLTHRLYFFMNHDMKWNIFDFVLVGLSSVEVLIGMSQSDGESEPANLGFIRIFRLLKFAKVFRVLRVLKVFKELAVIMESFRSCIAAMFWSFAMLLFVLYIFALIFIQGFTTYLLDHHSKDLKVSLDIQHSFGSVMRSILSLYMGVTGGNDWAVYYALISETGEFYSCLFVFFTFIFIFAIFNILTGTFVEKAVMAAMPDRDQLLMSQRENIINDASQFRYLFHLLDMDDSHTVTLDEFKRRVGNEYMAAYMAAIGLELHDVELFFKAVSSEGSEIDIDQFVEGCIAMKGPATSLDIQKALFETRAVKHSIDGINEQMRLMRDWLQKLMHQRNTPTEYTRERDVKAL